MHTSVSLLGAVAFSVILSTSAQAALLFRDTFTTPKGFATLDPSAPLVDRYEGTGQSGTLASPAAPIAYTTTGIPGYLAIYDMSRVYLTNNGGAASTTFSLNRNFTDSQNLKIDFTLDLPVFQDNNPAATGSVGFLRFGTGQNAELGGANPGGGAVAVYGNGDVSFFDGVGGVATFTSILLTNNNVFNLTLDSTNNYDGTGTVTAGLTLNGNVLDLNGETAGTSYTYSSGFTQNFLTFGYYSTYGQTDTKVNEFSVTAVPPVSGYSSWASGFTNPSLSETGATADPDNDGLTNTVEYALGLDPRYSSGAPGVTSNNGKTITFTKGSPAKTDSNLTYQIETSPTLGAAPSPWTVDTANVSNLADTIAITFPEGPVKNFARLKVILTSP